jgi:hypothetical protein
MNMKTLKKCSLGLALVTGLASAAKADIYEDFAWDPNVPANIYTSSGAITYDVTTGSISSFTFTDGPDGTFPTFAADYSLILLDGNLFIHGTASGSGVTTVVGGNVLPVTLNFNVPGTPGVAGVPTTGPGEQQVQDGASIWGDWVPVPEPTTYIAGAMLMIPFGASTLRTLRRKQV